MPIIKEISYYTFKWVDLSLFLSLSFLLSKYRSLQYTYIYIDCINSIHNNTNSQCKKKGGKNKKIKDRRKKNENIAA